MSRLLAGTAGHVDHGKTTLLKALTGIDCDRLPEEKRRGITLDLGFAHLDDGDVTVGFVDVPGHERFVHNALAGLGGLRLLLLVVAADEGARPQTREHLAIARLLGIPELWLVVTKIDAVEPGLDDLVELELRELLAATPWAAAPCFRVSAARGDGIAALRAALVARAREDDDGAATRSPARLPIDRAFSPRGQGVVVTGTLARGSLAVGDALRLEPGGAEVRIRGLQAHGRGRDEVAAGGRVAAQLGGVELAAVRRGQELVATGGPEPTRRLLARATLLPEAPTIGERGVEVTLHLGSAEVAARLRPLAPATLEPGDDGLVALHAREPLVAARGDRFVVRRPSPAATIGGGEILDPRWRRPRRTDLGAHLAAVAGSDESALIAWAEAAGATGLDAAEAGRRLGGGTEAARRGLRALTSDGRLVAGGERFFAPRVVAALGERATRLLTAFFAADRLAESMPKAELVRKLLPRRAQAHADLHLGWLAERKLLVLDGDRVAPPGRVAELTTGESGLAASILDLYERAGLEPPSPLEVARRLAAKPAIVDGLVKHLTSRKRLVRLPGGLIFAAAALESLAAELRASGWERFDVAQFKERYGLSRKWAIPLLEHLDSRGVTRRLGDLRQLVVGPR
ncbi:MAG: selenocysteine-specific translation elongation factor [Thermoanaerobaculia bacterium]|nr:selenocysteine-specific translation elongation factor [Thermoanaerobaculia bacterium]